MGNTFLLQSTKTNAIQIQVVSNSRRVFNFAKLSFFIACSLHPHRSNNHMPPSMTLPAQHIPSTSRTTGNSVPRTLTVGNITLAIPLFNVQKSSGTSTQTHVCLLLLEREINSNFYLTAAAYFCS